MNSRREQAEQELANSQPLIRLVKWFERDFVRTANLVLKKHSLILVMKDFVIEDVEFIDYAFVVKFSGIIKNFRDNKERSIIGDIVFFPLNYYKRWKILEIIEYTKDNKNKTLFELDLDELEDIDG